MSCLLKSTALVGAVLLTGMALAGQAQSASASAPAGGVPQQSVQPQPLGPKPGGSKVWKQAYFYVSLGGNDGNSGTITAPFATIGRCQAAMETSSAIKTCYIRAGVYNFWGSGSGCNISRSVFRLTQADTGTTYSYYPPDGYGSAVLDGGSASATTGSAGGFCISGAGNVTINGLTIRNYQTTGVTVFGNNYDGDDPNALIENNIIYNIYNGSAIQLAGYDQGSQVLHNYVANTTKHGIYAGTTQNASQGGLGNVVISGNVVMNTCAAFSDCGGIYIQDYQLPASTNITIQGNYVYQVFAGAPNVGGVGLYLDDGTSNVTATGNVIVAAANNLWTCFLLHGGSNNLVQGNLCDLGSAGGSPAILWYQMTSAGNATQFPMIQNVFRSNIVVCRATSRCGIGYFGADGPPNPETNTDNTYYNYGSGGAVTTTGLGGANGDANPVYANPNIQCWAVAIPGQPTPSYGPPGFVFTKSGPPPSWPHDC